MLELYLHLVGIFLGGNEQVGNYKVTMAYQRLVINIAEGGGGGEGEGGGETFEFCARLVFMVKTLLFIV